MVPGSGSFEPEIVVLHCEQSVSEEIRKQSAPIKATGFKARLVMLPCSSKVEPGHMLRILEEGADGVEIVGCPEGKCRFLVGADRAEKRVAYVARLLAETGLGAERVGMTRGIGISEKELVETAGRRANAVKQLGPNPMKGGNSE